MNNLKTEIEALINASQYEQAAQLAADKLNIKLKVLSNHWGKHFADDKDYRCIFKLRLSRGRKSYTFKFGQSIAAGGIEPTLYHILSCLQKYDVESFEEFCSDFGYNSDSIKSFKTYKAVVKEFEAMERLFTNEELEILQNIQ